MTAVASMYASRWATASASPPLSCSSRGPSPGLGGAVDGLQALAARLLAILGAAIREAVRVGDAAAAAVTPTAPTAARAPA